MINFWSIIRFAGTWRLARSLTIPQAEAAVCHCNFMLIEERELFRISFFSPFLLSHCPLVLPFFYFFPIFTTRSLNLVHTESEILLLSSIIAFVSDKSAVTKRDAEKTRGGTQQPAGSDVLWRNTMFCDKCHKKLMFYQVVECQTTHHSCGCCLLCLLGELPLSRMWCLHVPVVTVGGFLCTFGCLETLNCL